jgi:hypothetical protein
MLDTTLRAASLLLAAGLFGGMLLFAGGFAAFLFTALPAAQARMLIRQAFPPFYLVVIGGAAAAAVAAFAIDRTAAAWLLAIAVTTVPARQVLMPAINRATDAGAKARFARLHGLSVVVTLLHIAIAGMVVVRLAG